MIDIPHHAPSDGLPSVTVKRATAIDPWDDPRSLTSFQTFSGSWRSRSPSDPEIIALITNNNSSNRPPTRKGDGSLPNSECSSDSSVDGGTEDEELLKIRINLSPEDRRFGFSVVGGCEEGISPRIDFITKGSPADRADLEVGDEILEVNGRSLENCTHTEVIAHIHQCIRSRTICLRVKRKTGSKLALDLAQNSNVQDAFVIAVEQQARERLEKLSALKKIKPVDMTKLSQELNECPHTSAADLNGVIESNSIYVTSVPDIQNATLERARKDRLSISSNNGSLRRTPSPSSPNSFTGSAGGPGGDSRIRNGSVSGSSLNGVEAGHCGILSEEPEADYNDEDSVYDQEFAEDLDIPDQELTLKQDILDDIISEKSEKIEQTPAAVPDTTLSRTTTDDITTTVKVKTITELKPVEKTVVEVSVHRAEESPVFVPPPSSSVNDDNKVTVSIVPPASLLPEATPKIVADKLIGGVPSKPFAATDSVMTDVERGPHREMAVDVPDTFVGVSKTPPRYPPPKSSVSLTDALKHQKQRKNVNNNGIMARDLAPPVVTKSALKPSLSHDSSRSSSVTSEIPPAHLVSSASVEKPKKGIAPTAKPHANGRTLNAMTTPTAVKLVNGVTTVDVNVPQKNVKDDQIERIRKYQEDIRKRREEEDRIAREEEFLRSSLRGSKKLQALESSPAVPRSGVDNTAFELEEGDQGGTLPIGEKLGRSRLVGDVLDNGPEAPELSRIVGAPELLQSLHRIETQLKTNGHSQSEDLTGVENLFRNADFKKLLAVHNKVQEIWCFKCPPNPVTDDVENLTQEVMNSLQECSLPEATELIDILSKYEFEGLMYSHDKIAERQVVPAMTPDEELLDRASQYTDESVKIVRIDKTNEPLGATVRNEGEAVVIGRIVKGGAAEKSGLLHEGDEILEVNGIEMRGKSVNDVCDILATMTGTLTFLIIPTQYEKAKQVPKETMMHIKAHFDYDPDDDLYIPCRELGISFQKGDILHVINQDDANWWQAYREGEEDQTLAGLIPSKSFQQQREAMKQTIVGETNNKEKSKKGKFLCAKKHNKKKKKKVMYNVNANDDPETEILTYEEVSLYRPRPNRKRPIVLIGPPNIGRHELRQRLMENTERFAAAVPHTSRSRREPELDGVDYHFISRPQFESDIVGGKFVEHGEYEKSYYGTSLDAIRAVVNSGKICVLNLHPQSLKILKNSDLKPYIVLVAPPSLEKLRQNRLKMGASAKDDELKDIIEKAREMEENYGHYFDMIVINSDVDKAYAELLKEINILEKEPQWVPTSWLKNETGN